MRLKVYQAPNMGAAMAMVRDDLGPDALILAHRTVDDGVELTAAQEVAAEYAAPKEIRAERPLPEAAPFQAPPLPIAPSELARAGTLRWHGVPAELAARLGRGDLVLAIQNEFRFDELPCQPGDRPLLLVGPPGAGKTLTVARLATKMKLSGQSAMVITADGRRAGAAEQLAAFTRLLGLTLIVADTPKQLAKAVARRSANEPVLIDMPGLNPLEPADQQFARDCQAAIGAELAVVLPTGLDPADAIDIATGFRELGASLLIATRLDQSRRLGGLLAAAATGLSFTVAGISPGVADGLTKITPAFIADRLSFTRRPETALANKLASPVSPFALLARSRSEPPRFTP